MRSFALISVLMLFSSSLLGSTIVGYTPICTGASATFSDSIYTGTWASGNIAVATIDEGSGYLMGVSTGTAVITYFEGGTSYETYTVTIIPSPAPISGTNPICVGSTFTFTDPTSGGTWSSSSSHATVGSISGIVTGITDGYANIIYRLPSGCFAADYIVTGPPILDEISFLGDSGAICVGETAALGCYYSTPGVWSSSNTSIATVGTSGVVTGVSAGTAIISYVSSSACGTTDTTLLVGISGTTLVDPIVGPSSIYVGEPALLTDGSGGGSWASSNPAKASVVAASGVVTGIANGTAMMSYSVSGCGGILATVAPIEVTTLDGISGHVYFPSGYTGQVKVWLITFNTGTLMLEAVDSQVVGFGEFGNFAYYQFTGKPTDSFRIKAAIPVDSTATVGYIPTYHTSFYYWHDATVLWHTAGTADLNQDINMVPGITPTGPGFIAGNVTTGANRGTSTTGPATGLQMLLLSSGNVVEQTFTDASGNYSFSNLPLGTYSVHPELLNYISNDYPEISLTSVSTSVSGADFIQHTLSHTITPVTNRVAILNSVASNIAVYPNPTTGTLNIQWQETNSEKGSIIISDVTGREYYKDSIDLSLGGATTINLSALNNGLYIISIKSGNLNYNGKVQIQH